MNSTSVRGECSRGWSRAFGFPLACLLALFVCARAPAADDPLPRPPELERDVQFWIRVWTEITTNEGFLHDDRNLAVVYEKLRFDPKMSPRERQKIVDAARERYAAALRRIAAATGPLSPEDQRIRDLWGEEGTPARLREAAGSIRFQLGQADRFREGLVRSGKWEAHIAETFANMGLPAELAALPHVESSFNPSAYSKVGAAGLWQFMRSTGRRYLRIDSAVDDRLDPFRSTEAAAQLLAYNYRILGTWPLAITAYNHGAAGMRRAKEAMGTDDIVTIVRKYKSRTFGFASRNFYVSFLAALEVDRNPEKYFGPIERASEVRFQEVELPAYVPVAALERALEMDRDTLRSLNPALLPPVWSGQRYVPKGYRLRLPADGPRWTTERLAQRLGPNELYASHPVPSYHRVRRGETLSEIAQRYGVSMRELAELNGMKVNSTLHAGRELVLPGSTTPRTVAAAAAEPAPRPVRAVATTVSAAESTDTPGVYIVRRGDSLWEIARKVGLSESQLLELNRIRNPDFIYEGQRLVLSAPASDTSEEEEVEVITETVPRGGRRGRWHVPGSARADGGISVAMAQRESEEDAAAVAAIREPAEQAEPVSAAEAEALSPALGPGVETPPSPDSIDYAVADDGTIVVAAAETLGHYAEWLGIRASRLRQVNGMTYGRPLLLGQRIKLDFSKVSRSTFEERRREYHRALQASYFATHRIVGSEVYIARRGDSLWTVTQRFSRLPVWLLQQYNPDVNFNDMRPGTQIVVPKVEEVAAAGG